MTLQRAAIILSAIVVLGIGLSVPAILDIPSSWAVEPQLIAVNCCNIVGIQPNGLVTAQERAGARRQFQFQVNDPALLRSLRVGQPIQADLTTMRVSVRLDRLEPCCAIVSLAGKAIMPVPMNPAGRP